MALVPQALDAKEEAFEMLRQEGNGLYRDGRFQEAFERYRKALGLVASHASAAAALRNMAQCFWQLNKISSALQATLKSLRHDTENCKAHFRAAECFASMELWSFACFHHSECLRVDAGLFDVSGGNAKLRFAKEKRDTLDESFQSLFQELFHCLDVNGDGRLDDAEIERFWALAGQGKLQDVSGRCLLPGETLGPHEFRSRLRRTVAESSKNGKGPCKAFKAPAKYKKAYRDLNKDAAFYAFLSCPFDVFFHQRRVVDKFDQVAALAAKSGLPHEVCSNIVENALPKLLASIKVPFGKGSGPCTLELLSLDGEEEAWLAEGVCKSTPVSLCLALDVNADLVVAVKHLNKDLVMVETCLFVCEADLFIQGASAEGWADLVQTVCDHFGIQVISGIQCTAEFLQAERDGENTGDVTKETIAAALSCLRSTNVLAIPRWSELPKEEQWREGPMMMGWLADTLGSA